MSDIGSPGRRSHPDEDADETEADSLVRAVAAAPSIDPAPLGPELQAGTIVEGTFRIERRLGEGAMGVVYAALDLSLDRRIALKVHRQHRGDELRRSRMWREAKAMARLSHPNIVAVHEVGLHSGCVFIAMELVDGGSIRDWQRTRHPWREVLDVYLQAAMGLAAAHRVGLVHRDFKPDNMLIDGEGRVRVSDFGLARAAHESVEGPPMERSGSSDSFEGSISLDERLTQTGAAVGTPAYMSPEQLSGLPLDHRTDQFAFCIALYEALYGERPFASTSAAQLLADTSQGAMRPPPTDRTVPRWLRAVVVRGLKPDPDDRHPDMDVLIAALRADPSRRRRRVAALGAVAVAIGATAWGTRIMSQHEPPCRHAGAAIADTWNDDVATSVEASLLGTGSALGNSASARVRVGLDAYADAWSAARVEACEATHVRGEQSETLLDQRMACLDRRHDEVRAAIQVLQAADADVVEHAVDVVDGLGELAPCADLEALAAVTPLPEDPTARETVLRLQEEHARLDVEWHARRRVADMRDPIDALVRDADATGHAPLRAEAHRLRASLELESGDKEAATADLSTAHEQAIAAGDARLAAKAAIQLARQIGQGPREVAEAMRWLGLADAWWGRTSTAAEDRVLTSVARATVHFYAGNYELAESIASITLSAVDALGHHDAHERRELLQVLGVARSRRARFVEAAPVFEQAVALAEQSFGSDHPVVANVLADAAQNERALGRVEQSLAMIRRGHVIRAAAYGADSLAMVPSHREVAVCLAWLGRWDEALAEEKHALAILDAHADAKPAERMLVLGNHANTLQAIGEKDRAVEVGREVIAITAEEYGPESMRMGEARLNLGSYLAEAGRDVEAVVENAAAREILAKHLGETHPSVALCDLNIAVTSMTAGRLEEAGRAIERVEKASESLPAGHEIRGHVAKVAAELHAERKEWDAALERIDEALAVYEQLAPHGEETIEALRTKAQLLTARGDATAAIAPLERALQDADGSGMTPPRLAGIQLELAQALVHDRARKDEAIALARTAETAWQTAGDVRATEATTWLARHAR